MANAKRQVSIFINDKEVEGSIKQISTAFKVANNELKKMVVGSKEYTDKLEEVGKLKTVLDTHNKQLKTISGSLVKTGGALEEIAGVAAAAFAVDNLLQYGRQVFDMGVKLDQMGKKARIVFGEVLPFVSAEATKNAQAMGLTNAQYIAAAANIQDLLVPMGFQRKEAALISTQLVNLSGALSEWSTNGISATEVNNILSDALLGETDALKQLGISISAADIDAALLAKGLDKLTGASRQQAEAAATLELIMAKSADAQAAYAANSGSVARQQAEATARFSEIAEKIATALLPVFTKLMTIANAVGGAFLFIANAGNEAAAKNTSLGDSVRDLQGEFNAEIAVLKEGNFTKEERAVLIGEINSKYKEYLPNLISEKSSLEDINKVQVEANKLFSQKILFLALQDEITEATKKGAEAAKAAFAAEKERARLQTQSNFQDNAGYEEYVKGQINLAEGVRNISLETVQQVPKEIEGINKLYGNMAVQLGTNLSDLQKKFAVASGVTPTGGGDGSAKDKRSKEAAEEAEWQKIYANMAAQRANINSGVNAIIEGENNRHNTITREQSLANLNQGLLDYQTKTNERALVDLNYEEEQDAAKERIRVELLSDQALEIESIQQHYIALIELAKRYGIDTLALEKEQNAKIRKVTKDAEDQGIQETKDALEAKYKAYAASFSALGDLVSDSLTLISGENAKSHKAQKVATLAKIAFDTAAAISSLVAHSSQNPLNAVTFGSAGFAQYVAGFARIVANMAQARKILSSAPEVTQRYGGGYMVKGQDDGRTYNANVIGRPQTGLLPGSPVLFQSAATGQPVLASERGAEYFVSNENLRDPYVANLVKMIDATTTRGVSQFANGGMNTTMPSGAGMSMDTNLLMTLNATLAQLQMVLSAGVYARLDDRTLIESQKRFNTINDNTGGYFTQS